MKDYEYASIENKEDYKNFLKYIKEGNFDIDIDDNGVIYAENYRIEVKKGFESIYDDIESIFNPRDEIDFNYKPEKILTVQGVNFNVY